MPDRVRLPQGVARRYKDIYKQIREQQCPDSVARSIALQIGKDVRRAAKPGTELVAHMANYLQPLNQDTLLRDVPEAWDDAYKEVDRARAICNHANQLGHQYIDQAAKACKQQMIRFEEGNHPDSTFCELDVAYRKLLYKSQLQDPILLNKGGDELHAYMQQLEPAVNREIENKVFRSHEQHVPSLEETLAVDIFEGL